MDQIPDINEWLVTPQNPPRAIDGLDYERCAALHNYLVRYAWVASNRPLCDLKFQSWFDNHGNAANDLRSRLGPNLVKFLEAVYDPSGSDDTILFYWVSGLTYPDELWFDWEGYAEDGEESRRMTLYRTNSGLLGGHNDGLCYDQKLHKAAMFISIDDQDFANRPEHEHLWHPLETVLSNWISTIRIGKISAGPRGVKLHNEKYGPWMYHSYSPQQVEETVTAFNRLVIAIERRIPKSAKKWPTSNPLISQQILDSTSVPNPSFARSFLTMIRPPNFKYIAPGLLLPTPESFASSQPFISVKHEDDKLYIPSVMLFQAEGISTETENENDSTRSANTLAQNDKPSPPGLYTMGTSRGAEDTAEEGFRLILPFSICENGHARKSTGQLIEERDYGGFNDLYQHGFKPFGGDWSRAQRLVKLLDNWTGMVEKGLWQIGEDGVEGGIEKFKEADTEAGWKKYWIEPDW